MRKLMHIAHSLKIIGLQSLLSVLLFTTSSLAIDSESSFDYLTTEDGKRVNLHGPGYTTLEISIVDEAMLRLVEPESRLKNDFIARALVKLIKDKHRELLMDEIRSSCIFLGDSCLPKSNELEDLVRHSLYGRKFLCFGRNRTFNVLVVKLQWLDEDDQPTSKCPSVFRKEWEKALSELSWR